MSGSTVPIKQASQKSFKDELHPTFERRKWAVDRVIWALMFATVVAALLGVFGSGLFSRETIERAHGGGTIELEHPRLARFHSPEDLRLTVHAPDATGDTLRVALSSEFTSQAQVRRINPEPDAVSVGPEGTVAEWQVRDWSQPVVVDVQYEPDDWGRIGGSIEVQAGEGEAETIDFSEIVFP